MLRGIDPALVEKNLDAMLARLKQRSIPVLLAGMVAAPNLGHAYGEAFGTIYPRLAEKYGVPLYPFFLGNPAVNGIILGILLAGIVYIFRQVQLLNPEVDWIERFRRNQASLTPQDVPRLLAPMARMLGDELATRLQTETAGAAAGLSKDMGPLGRLSGQLEDSGYRRLLLELGHEPTTLDELVQRTGQSAAALSSMLLMLELEGGIESLPGNRYQCLPAGFPDD